MAFYDSLFNVLGLREWCDSTVMESDTPKSMAELLADAAGKNAVETPWYDIPFPSLDNLNQSCSAIDRTRDMTSGVEKLFLDIKDPLKVVLDPLTQPLSWLLDGSLYLFTHTPWWVLIPLVLFLSYKVTRSWATVLLVAATFIFFAFIDHYTYAIETLSIIFVCTVLCILFGIPIGILMSKKRLVPKNKHTHLGYVTDLAILCLLDSINLLIQRNRIKTLRNCDHVICDSPCYTSYRPGN